MRRVIVRYAVKPGQERVNEKLVRAVCAASGRPSSQAGPIDTDMNPENGQSARSLAASQPSGSTGAPMTSPP